MKSALMNAILQKIREYESDAEMAIQEREGYGADELFGKVAGLREALETIEQYQDPPPALPPSAKRVIQYLDGAAVKLPNRWITVARSDDGTIYIETRRYVGNDPEIVKQYHHGNLKRGILTHILRFTPDAWNAAAYATYLTYMQPLKQPD